MNNISIDTNKIKENIEKLKKIKKELEDMNKSLGDETELLKDDWVSNTSESFYSSYPDFQKSFEQLINNIDLDIAYLDTIVNYNYEKIESITNKQVDEKIAI